MKRKNQWFKPYGLRARFAKSLILSALLCGLVFFILYHVSDYYLTEHLESPEYTDAHMQQQGANLQAFITENEISSADLTQLKTWENRQPMVLLELYVDGERIYSSFDAGEDMPRRDLPPDGQLRNDERAEPPDEQRQDDGRGDLPGAQRLADERSVPIHLADIDVQALIFSDAPYQYYVISTAACAVIAFILFVVLYLLSTRKLIRYICKLNDDVHILEGGNLEYEVSVEGNDELTDLARSMNSMRTAFRQQLASENALHRANKRLVTEMSHDLRTPLTGMMLYLEILRSHRYQTEEELQDYLEKIDAKAQHMKQLSDHLFAYSLEKSPERGELQTAEQAFGEALSGVTDELRTGGFRVAASVTWPPCFVQADRESLRRILENIVSNIGKYADPSAEVVLNSIDMEEYCGFSVMNACAAREEEPPESSGVGIESIRSMMRQMSGLCTVEQTEAAFEITLLFPKY